MQQRLESSSVGRAIISALLLVTVASVAISSLTDSSLKTSLLRHDQAFLDVTGLDQRWDLFAPDPRRRVIDARARIEYAGGPAEVWRLPRGATAIGVYWDHRWRKWMDNAARFGPRSPVWPWLAAWLARERRREGRRPVRVSFIGRWYELRPPGAGPDRGPWREAVLYRGLPE